MGTAIAVRTDFSSQKLRRLATRVKDAAQARRLLAIAAVLDSAAREEAAKAGGMDRQTLRDWVIRFNDQGPDGLINKWSPGAPGKLSKERMLSNMPPEPLQRSGTVSRFPSLCIFAPAGRCILTVAVTSSPQWDGHRKPPPGVHETLRLCRKASNQFEKIPRQQCLIFVAANVLDGSLSPRIPLHIHGWNVSGLKKYHAKRGGRLPLYCIRSIALDGARPQRSHLARRCRPEVSNCPKNAV
jgi:Winged helix-turn helix